MKGAVGFIGLFLSFLSESFGNQLQVSCLDSCKVFCIICEEYGKDSMECLSFIIAHYCLANFNEEMKSQNMDDWCNWDKVSWYYSAFSNCTEEHSECLLIPWPNSLVESFFVSIHSEFFQNCSTEEFSDPPPAVVFTLVITPICLIPVMVSLVVLKTKNGDGTS